MPQNMSTPLPMFAGKSGLLRSFLIARGDIANLEDDEGHRRFSHVLGEPQDCDQLKVNLEWGKEKEYFAILAAKKKLSELQSEGVKDTDQILETGFTSCLAYRYEHFLRLFFVFLDLEYCCSKHPKRIL